ncbi:hypothetical protein GQ55_3G369600 [Panicum hallii var. hallii]|uniref:Uncharacterized protein n=1 Tax=Panicum hallii var. hallii TaxID=1504633 RepID=A0A2T7EG67_9POAL|nr:hypothetical protein GQ55_3G369600 [Panicum hallii var. hallii]
MNVLIGAPKGHDMPRSRAREKADNGRRSSGRVPSCASARTRQRATATNHSRASRRDHVGFMAAPKAPEPAQLPRPARPWWLMSPAGSSKASRRWRSGVRWPGCHRP